MTENSQGPLISRYGLWDNRRHSLAEIAESMALTRERVRQLENEGKIVLKKRFDKQISSFLFRSLQTIAQANCYSRINEETVLEQLGTDCTKTEATLALHFLQDLQPTKRSLRLYVRQ